MAECKTCGQNLPEGFCHSCLRDFPPETMSADPRYCPECFWFLSAEASLFTEKSKKADWIPWTGGQDVPSDGGDTPQARGDDVSEIAERGIIPTTEATGILLQGKGRGRPRKQDGELVSRMTKWRRKKEREKQGVLL